MNFNMNTNPEYDLNASLIDEMINLYGILTKFIIVEHINSDDIIFKDYSSIKTNSSDIYEVYMMPENSDSWDNSGYMYSQFGLANMDNINLFCSKTSIDFMGLDIKNLISNLVVLPNNKIMEITNFEFEVPGINNLYTYNNSKSVYKLSLKPYNVKLNDEINKVDILHQDSEILGKQEYDTLEKYFDELLDLKSGQDIEAEINNSVDTVIKTGNADTKDIITKKPIIDKSEDDVFGNF